MGSLHKAIAGFLLALASSVFYVLGFIFVRFIPEISMFEIIAFRAAVSFLLAVVWVLLKNEPVIVWKNPYVWLIGIFFAIMLHVAYLALLGMSVGESSAIFFAQPILVGILAYFILKEAFDPLDALFTILLIVGVVFVAQPKFLRQWLHVYPGTICPGDGGTGSLPLPYKLIDGNVSSETFSRTSKNNLDNPTNEFLIKVPEQLNSTNDPGTIGYILGSELDMVDNRSGVFVYSPEDANDSVETGCGNDKSEGHEGMTLSRAAGCSLAVAAAFASSLVFIFNKKAPDVFVGTILSQSCAVICLSAIISTSASGLWTFPAKGKLWGWLLLSTISSLTGQASLFLALKYQTAAAVAMARATEIPTSFVLQFLILRIAPNEMDIIGAAIIFVVVFASAGKRFYKEGKSSSKEIEMEGIPILLDIKK